MKKIIKHLWLNDRIFNIFMLLCIFNFLIIANYSLIYSHENSHKEIFDMYGCDSEIHIEFMSGYTQSINCDLDNANMIAMRISQANVEATYVDMTFYRFVLILLTLIFFQLVKIKRENGKR